MLRQVEPFIRKARNSVGSSGPGAHPVEGSSLNLSPCALALPPSHPRSSSPRPSSDYLHHYLSSLSELDNITSQLSLHCSCSSVSDSSPHISCPATSTSTIRSARRCRPFVACPKALGTRPVLSSLKLRRQKAPSILSYTHDLITDLQPSPPDIRHPSPLD